MKTSCWRWRVSALLCFGLIGSLNLHSQAVPWPVARIERVFLSAGRPIHRFAQNGAGTVAAAVGGQEDAAERLILVTPDETIQVAAVGDPVPGQAGRIFAGFRTRLLGQFALNDRDELVFAATTSACAECGGDGSKTEGLFLFSEGALRPVLLEGDAAPSTRHAFRYFNRLRLDNEGRIALLGVLERLTGPDPPEPDAGLFLVSGGRVEKIAMSGDPAIPGRQFRFNGYGLTVLDDQFLLLDQAGAVTFADVGGIFRYATGRLEPVAAWGQPAPGGGSYYSLFGIAGNVVGDLVFQGWVDSTPRGQGLFALTRALSASKLLTEGDATPLGGTYAIAYPVEGHRGSYYGTTRLGAALNSRGTTAFGSPAKDGPSLAGLFLARRGAIEKIVASGDPIPGDRDLRFDLVGYDSEQRPHLRGRALVNDSDLVAFSSGTSVSAEAGALFVSDGLRIVPLILSGDPAPGAAGVFQDDQFRPFAINGAGEIAFHSKLCCGEFTEGIFLGSLGHPALVNGGFETPGEDRLPAGWSSSWASSGAGEVFRYDGAGQVAFQGTSVLRLHVAEGGGSVFALSDPLPVAATALYRISARLRYKLDGADDRVFLAVVQYDASGREIAVDEVQGSRDNGWRWKLKRVLVRAREDAVSIRIRFGLKAGSEAYLDVDALE